MRNFAQKMMLAGIGAFALTREKAEQVVNEMVKKGQVQGEDAESVLDDLMERGEQERDVLKKTIRTEFDRIKNDMNLITKKELEEISERISQLEKRLSSEAHKDRTD